LAFFAALPPTEVAMEACGGAHHWGRSLSEQGHRVRLIPPQYVKPFVRRGKNDRNDAEAIATAAAQPTITSVPVKSVTQQARAMLLKVRETLVGQRTARVNELRGHGQEFGLVAAKGNRGLRELRTMLADAPEGEVPGDAKEVFALLGAEIDRLDLLLSGIDRKLIAQCKKDADSRRLCAVPGIGAINALTLTRTVDFTQFKSGRHFAAWLGLVPREHSTGGKQRLGGISRAGNERLRSLLVTGATSVIRHMKPMKPGRGGLYAWLEALLKRRPRKLAAVALANKMARVVWAMMTRGEAYRQQPAAA
jgi:transposase